MCYNIYTIRVATNSEKDNKVIIMTIKGNVLTEKGLVKANARKALADYVATHREVFGKAERNANGTYSVAIKDESGNVVYINFEVTVSTMCAGDRAKKKTKAKTAENVEAFDVE